MRGAGAPDLALHRVWKRFGGIAAVADVSLSLRRGERCALIGPNGAGKTTLFNLIAGDMRPSAGRVHLFGRDVTGLLTTARVRRGMRRTYQTSALFDALSVAENLLLGVVGPTGHGHFAMARSVYADAARWRRAEEVAAQVGLQDRFLDAAGALSHGERRQLEIGLALCAAPRLVLLDEPAAGLSPEERTSLGALLARIPADVTVLIIEHDMDIALSLSERVIVMNDGAIVAEGDPDAIMSNPVVQQVYLGHAGHVARPAHG